MTAPTMSPESATPDADRAWSAVVARDAASDGAFVYAVTTTGIYCRPACPARRPKREHVAFFATPADAERAGFRACLRCRPSSAHPPAGVQRVDWARELIDERVAAGEPVTLAALAETVGMSPYHLQRTFKAETGLSPAAYARMRRRERLRHALDREPTVSRAIAAAGYGSESRVYERGAALLGMTPAQYRAGGRGVEIHFAIASASLGYVIAAATGRGVCAIAMADSAAELEAALALDYPGATLVRADTGVPAGATASTAAHGVARYLDGAAALPEFPLHVGGTAFQRRVWQALREIPRGETLSYTALAARIGAPSATRAVAGACAANPVAVVVPCHRVVRSDGSFSGYRWGIERKKALLARERA